MHRYVKTFIQVNSSLRGFKMVEDRGNGEEEPRCLVTVFGGSGLGGRVHAVRPSMCEYPRVGQCIC